MLHHSFPHSSSILPSLAGQPVNCSGPCHWRRFKSQCCAVRGSAWDVAAFFNGEKKKVISCGKHLKKYRTNMGELYYGVRRYITLISHQFLSVVLYDFSWFPSRFLPPKLLRRLALDMAPLVPELRSLVPWCCNKNRKIWWKSIGNLWKLWKSIGNLWQNLWKSMAKNGKLWKFAKKHVFTNWISLGSPMVHHDIGMEWCLASPEKVEDGYPGRESGFHLAALVAAKMQGVNTWISLHSP